MKVAVLSMDLEDWYHLDYFESFACDRDRSLLNGVDVYREILESNGIRSTFFVLGELAKANPGLLADLAASGHEIAAHGWNHTRPLTMSDRSFAEDLRRTRDVLGELTGDPPRGYRAPCFSLDRKRLDEVRAAGFSYDSSRMPVAEHPLYGSIDVADFERISPSVYRAGRFLEYQLSVLPLAGRRIPVSGGAYVRILPWPLMKLLIDSYLERNDLYFFYVHPFELSPEPTPPLPTGTTLPVRLRFGLGRSSVARKLSRLIALLRKRGFRFSTFAELRHTLLGDDRGPADSG